MLWGIIIGVAICVIFPEVAALISGVFRGLINGVLLLFFLASVAVVAVLVLIGAIWLFKMMSVPQIETLCKVFIGLVAVWVTWFLWPTAKEKERPIDFDAVARLKLPPP